MKIRPFIIFGLVSLASGLGLSAAPAVDEVFFGPDDSAFTLIHPLKSLDSLLQDKLVLAEINHTPSRDELIQCYLQDVGRYFKDRGISYTASLTPGQEMFLEIAPGATSVFNRMAQDWAAHDFKMRFDFDHSLN